MTQVLGDFVLSDDKSLIQINRVHEMLLTTYWARNRSIEVMQKSIDNSLCFGIYKEELQIGFARCITDYAVLYYLADVVIDEAYRGQGLGKALMKFISEHEQVSDLIGFLNTKDAHGLYEQFGYKTSEGEAMARRHP